MLKSFDRGKQEWRLVSAAGVELVLDVEGAELRVHHEQMFLSQTQATGVRAGRVGGCPGHQGPSDLESPFQRLEIPHIVA